MTRLWLALALSAGWLVAAPASAQSEGPATPPAPSSDAATAAYRAAQAAYRDGDVAGALASMSEAYRISQRKELLYNVAELERELGQCRAALRDYRAYLHDAPRGKHRPKAEQVSDALSAECPDQPPVNDASAPGPRVELLSTVRAAPETHRYWTAPRVLGWSAIAAGALAAGAALDLTLAAKAARDDVQASVDAQVAGGPHWDEQSQRDQHRDQTWAQISGIGAGAFILGGALLVLFDPGRESVSDGNLSVAFRPGGARPATSSVSERANEFDATPSEWSRQRYIGIRRGCFVLNKLRTARWIWVSERPGPSAAVRRLLCIALLLGGWPLACLSDVQLPACVERDDCGGSAGSATAGDQAAGSETASSGTAGTKLGGDGGAGSHAGVIEDAGMGGEAGVAGGQAGAPGTPCETCSLFPVALPAACANDPYATSLHLVGGTPPYRASVSGGADDLSLGPDPDHLNDPAWFRLAFTPTGATNLTLQFVDAEGRVFTQPYPVQPRTACWLAYVRLTSGAPELVLVDPILNTTPPIALVNNHDVYDFRFSPNGRFLAYRYGRDPAQPSRAHLALLDLVAWQERALSFDSEEAVTAFAWSADSLTLAVAYSQDDSSAAGAADEKTTYLGGVRLSIGANDSPHLVTLDPVQAYVESDLYWAATDSVVFHSTVLGPDVINDERFRVPYFAKLESNGFESPVLNDGYQYDPDTGLVVQPTPDGFYMISEHSPNSNFYPLPADLPAVNHWDHVVSPSGAFSATVVDTRLQLFRATDYADDAPFVADPDALSCPRLLTWASGNGRERLACVANVDGDPAGSTHGEVRIFDLAGSSLTSAAVRGFCLNSTSGPALPECGAKEYRYGEQPSQQQARAFSASGKWFAFTTSIAETRDSGWLYLADLRSSPFVIVRGDSSDLTTPTSNIALAFSPDERYLLQQRDGTLTVHDVPSSGQGKPWQKLPTLAKHSPVSCSDDFFARERWCGDARTDSLFAWSSESRSFVYRTAQGLTVVDLDAYPTLELRTLPADECQDECTNQFAFQPRP